jgi:hypothetical protein
MVSSYAHLGFEALPHEQRGAALIVSLIMLLLLTVIVTSAFTLSSTNFRSVTNMQEHDEAVAAANGAIEQAISAPFYQTPAPQAINIDINNDGVTDYVVNLAAPTCVSASIITPTAQPPTSQSLSGLQGLFTNYYDTVWDLDAVVNDPTTGAAAEVHEGVRVLLDQTQYGLVCS